MIRPLFCIFAIFLMLVIAEVAWRKKILRGETARKCIHVCVGTFIAFWPFIITFRAIQLISASLFLVIVLSWWFGIFKGIHTVKRKTVGELFFPMGIGLAATLTQNKWIFAAAILHVGLADGLAAAIGLRFGKKTRYLVNGQVKSIIGTLTFVVISILITAWVIVLTPTGFNHAAYPAIIVLPLLAALVENIAPVGSDNLFVPLLVVGILGSLQFLV